MGKRIISALAAVVVALGCSAAAAAAEDMVRAPSGLVEHGGKLLVTDVYQKVVWELDSEVWTRYAGALTGEGADGEPAGGYQDGDADKALFGLPWAAARYRDGIAVTDTANHAVRYIANGQVKTLAGGKGVGFVDGKGMSAQFDLPTGLTSDNAGNLYVADTGNHAIRKVDPDGAVTTLAGGTEGRADGTLKQARFSEPTGLCWQGGALYLADSGNNRVCRLMDGQVVTLAGTGEAGYTEGPAAKALLDNPQGVAVGDAVFVADTHNSVIRSIQDAETSTIFRADMTESGLYPAAPRGLLYDEGTLYVADPFAGRVYAAQAQASSGLRSFQDVPETAWYAQAVRYVTENGLFSGTDDTHFSPEEPMTRGMLVTVLYRFGRTDSALDVPEGEKMFSDIPSDAYYAQAVRWAGGAGLAAGEDGAFYPGRSLTREELATLLYRYALASGRGGLGANVAEFPDETEISPWAADAVRWAAGRGLLAGSDGRLQPQAPATRAETAQILMRLLS